MAGFVEKIEVVTVRRSKRQGYTLSTYATATPLSIDDDHFNGWQLTDDPFTPGSTTK